MEDRDLDKEHIIRPTIRPRASSFSLDVIKSRFITSTITAEELAEEYAITKSHALQIIEEHRLADLRKEYVREGLEKIKGIQVHQSNKLLDIELNFKRMRIIQLEAQLSDFMAYYSRNGDFKKRHPHTGEVLKDTNGIDMQIPIPNLSREINQLKEAITMSEGLKQMLTQLDDILNKKPVTQLADKDVITLSDSEFDALFEQAPKE
jgi:hypothetical protein